MSTLHIEHAITSYPDWKAAFDRFAPMRTQAGCRAHRVSRLVGDERYLVIDLDFDTVDAAQAFLAVLEDRVWSVPANSPALVGSPATRVLEVVDVSAADQARATTAAS